MSRIGSTIAALLVLGRLGLPGHAATPPTERDDAATWYSIGMAHMKASEYTRAAVAFDEAFARDDATVHLWNSARAYDQSGDIETAKARYHQFLIRDDAPAKLRKWTVGRIQALDEVIQSRLVEEAVETERVKLATLRQQVLDEIRRGIASGSIGLGEPDAARSWVSPQTETELDARAEDARRRESLELAGWVTGGVGIALLIAATVLQVDADALGHDLANPRRNEDGAIVWPSQAEAQRMQRQAEDESTAAAVGFALGGTLTVSAIVLLVVAAVDGDDATAVSVSRLPGGLVLSAGASF